MILRATARRTSGSLEMPLSSLEMAMTAAPYFLMSGQHLFQPLFFAGHRVDQRLALVGRQPLLQRRHDGRIDGQAARR